MSFYFTLTIYYIAKSQPLLASLFASLALSIKAGGILILPPLLACVQYGFGTIKLIKAIALYIALQIIFAAPFVNDYAAYLIGS